MTMISEHLPIRDIENVARRLLGEGGRDIIMDEFGSFTMMRPRLGATPQFVIDAVVTWIANCELMEEDGE